MWGSHSYDLSLPLSLPFLHYINNSLSFSVMVTRGGGGGKNDGEIKAANAWDQQRKRRIERERQDGGG